MNTYVLWVEMNEAKIFLVSSKEKDLKVIRRHKILHHTASDPSKHKDCEKFFHEIASYVQNADEILLAGPKLTKEHFLAHLARHHHETLAKKVVGNETLKSMSDARLMAYSRDFFKHYDSFEQPIAQ